jgi:nucleoside-diphosphate-sugar epimerase
MTLFVKSFIYLSCVLSVVSALRATLAMNYLGSKPVFVAGGSRGVGLEVVKQLSALGTPVQTLVRNDEAKANLEGMDGVKVFLGDALDESCVQQAMGGCVAAVTTLSGKTGEENKPQVDYMGNSNVIEQAGILGVERIVLVTSVGCGETKGAVAPEVYSVLSEMLEAKNKAERDLKLYTNLDWTIIRPGSLNNDEPTGQAILTENKMVSGTITRSDTAALIVKTLGSGGATTRRELTAIGKHAH